jgi:hypothetical protein
MAAGSRTRGIAVVSADSPGLGKVIWKYLLASGGLMPKASVCLRLVTFEPHAPETLIEDKRPSPLLRQGRE